MQSDNIVLPVDVLNNGTPVNATYTRYEEQANRSVYIGALHTPDARDVLGLYRTFPTKSGNFKGTGKSTVKFTTDVSVLGVDGVSNLTAPIIIDVSFSVPVGVTVADVVEARQRVIALLDNDTIMNSLNIQLMV